MSPGEWWAAFRLLRLSKPAGDRPLYRSLRSRPIASVLEIGVGSEQRLRRLIDWNRRQGGTLVRYAAIDPFESEGRAPLKDVHRRCAALQLKPILVPGPVAVGLPRVASTVGAVDLVIINEHLDQFSEPRVQAMLPRILGPATLALAVVPAGGRVLQPVDLLERPLSRSLAA